MSPPPNRLMLHRLPLRIPMAMPLLALLMLLFVSAAPQQALAGQVHHEDVQLADLLDGLESGAAAVVTLTLATPATQRQDWPVPGKGAKKCPAYRGYQYHGRVEAVHFASRNGPTLRAGAQLAVTPANMPDLVYLEHLACAEGISKSPIWQRFSGIEPKAGQQVIAVLRWQQELGWLERMSGAWLDVQDLPKILKLLPPGKRFSAVDALRAEWSRKPPAVRPDELDVADRPRLVQTLARIGAPGAPALLPPELATPTEEQWLVKAEQAREPLDRLTALMFLNRLKSKRSWQALKGLTARDAAEWPAEPDLTWALQTAEELSPPPAELTPFLERWQKRPVTAARQAALMWRRFLTGEAKAPGPVVHTRAELLATSEQWGRATEEQRARGLAFCRQAWRESEEVACLLRWGGSLQDFELGATLQALRHGWGASSEEDLKRAGFLWPELQPRGAEPSRGRWPALLRLMELAAMEQLPQWAKALRPGQGPPDVRLALGQDSPPWRLARALPTVRLLDAAAANLLRDRLLTERSPLARAAAIEDLPTAPTQTSAIVAQIAQDLEVDAAQALVAAVARWKLSPTQAKSLLTPLLTGAAWAVRLQAWQALVQADAATPWPSAPQQSPQELEILALAEQLLTSSKPVRLSLEFASPLPGKPAEQQLRRVVLRLDSYLAPLNVAKFLHLARKGFYNGRAVSRVVPEFVVQLGSPVDTMDGGPGYHVPCENHLKPYTAGSVGMALSGKDTGGSQFFVTLAATPHLTGRYTRLGAVEDLPKALAVLRDLGPGDVLVAVREL